MLRACLHLLSCGRTCCRRYHKYRQATHNLRCFPDATACKLDGQKEKCAICRETMQVRATLHFSCCLFPLLCSCRTHGCDTAAACRPRKCCPAATCSTQPV